MRIVTLMTDFGMKDPYVGIMKGIILSCKKNVQIIDITHNIKCGDIKTGAFFLSSYYKYFPEKTINIVVIDPMVGERSIPILSIFEERFFLGPDNGVLTSVLGDVYKIKFKKGDSNTFFGRDIYAPFAVNILRNKFKGFLEEYKNPSRITMEYPVEKKGFIVGKVIHIDNFGNIITNINSSLVDDRYTIKYKEKYIPLFKSYSDVKKGKILGLINSFNLLEISVNLGDASKIFNAKIGDKVYLIRRKDV